MAARRSLGAAATLSLALLAAGVIFGPCLVATSTTPPMPLTRLTLPPRGLLRVRIFPPIDDGSCVPLEPSGLREVQLMRRGSFARYRWDWRIQGNVWSCLLDWYGDMTVTVSADQIGSLAVRAVGSAPEPIRRCVEHAIAEGLDRPVGGPGRMQVGYYRFAPGRPERER